MPTASHCARANHPQGPNQRLDVEIRLRSHASATQGDAGLPLRSVPDRKSQNQAILEQASSDSAYGVSPFHGPNRKSNAGLGTSPRNTTGQGPPTRQASSTTRTKPRNSNDSHRSSLPRTTRIQQTPGLNREPAADIRFSPTAPPNTDQSPTPPSTRNPGTKPITHIPDPHERPRQTHSTNQTGNRTPNPESVHGTVMRRDTSARQPTHRQHQNRGIPTVLTPSSRQPPPTILQTPPSRGPKRKSIAKLGISPRDTTGQGPPALQASPIAPQNRRTRPIPLHSSTARTPNTTSYADQTGNRTPNPESVHGTVMRRDTSARQPTHRQHQNRGIPMIPTGHHRRTQPRCGKHWI